jgi:hypothetical protein
MSKIALSGNASGTGTLTIAAPNTNSDFTLSLPATTAPILAGSGITLSASAPANTLVTDASGNVLVNGTSTTAKFAVANNDNDGTYSIRQYAVFGPSTTYLDSDASVLNGAGIGEFQIQNGTSTRPAVLSLGGSLATDEGLGVINFFRSGNTDGYRSRAQIAGVVTSSGTANQHGGFLTFRTAADGATTPTERARIDSSGNLLVGKTATGISTVGTQMLAGGPTEITTDGNRGLLINRKTSDGQLVAFDQDGTTEGSISVSGTTVSYNGGHLSRWAQATTAKDESLVKGTVLSNLDEMNVYTDAEGNPVKNEQLNKVKVSDVEGDANVAGVFVNWDHDEDHNVDEINMAMTGDMIIRIAEGVTVARGDLLMSAGDGTAKPQGDDIVRSKTIAKVTSTHVTCTYADGSFCVPCVLMAC